MHKDSDIRVTGVRVWFLPVETRMPYKFGSATLTRVTCARVAVTARDGRGRVKTGWGETPLSVGWVWPGEGPSLSARESALQEFVLLLARAIAGFPGGGHALEIGHDFQAQVLPGLARDFNAARGGAAMPHLAALVCLSPFDLAIHDAFGRLADRPVYDTYNDEWMNRDLAACLSPADGSPMDFRRRFPEHFLKRPAPDLIPAWHAVGVGDPLDAGERTGDEPEDGHPVTLEDWIGRDGLTCLKIKLAGADFARDHARIGKVARIGLPRGVRWLCCDFNCTVRDPAYVVEILDRLKKEAPEVFDAILYVEQPFPYDLEAHPIDVRAISRRKPLFMDESAHDWRLVRRGLGLGWTGVALKTCKTQTGALLSLAWARSQGMSIMVQDLTNPMLAQITHLLLAAHAGTIMGAETNSMQYYPEASAPEARVHPGMFRRRGGMVDVSTARGPGFGYRLEEIARELGAPAAALGVIE